MIVVSDASPLATLANMGRSDLLPALYGRVLIPAVVRDELRAKWPGPFPPTWLDVADVGAPPPAEAAGLDPGEAAAIALAFERSVDLLLIDERQGRAVAERLGLTARGLLGVLVAAKAAGLIGSVADLFPDLDRAGFYYSAGLKAAVLRSVGELGPPDDELE